MRLAHSNGWKEQHAIANQMMQCGTYKGEVGSRRDICRENRQIYHFGKCTRGELLEKDLTDDILDDETTL